MYIWFICIFLVINGLLYWSVKAREATRLDQAVQTYEEFQSIHNTCVKLNTSLKISKSKYIEFEMHWFEFVYTNLLDKLFLPNGESRLDGIKSLEYYRVHENIHPVDYLYQKFLKLN